MGRFPRLHGVWLSDVRRSFRRCSPCAVNSLRLFGIAHDRYVRDIRQLLGAHVVLVLQAPVVSRLGGGGGYLGRPARVGSVIVPAGELLILGIRKAAAEDLLERYDTGDQQGGLADKQGLRGQQSQAADHDRHERQELNSDRGDERHDHLLDLGAS